jgi:CBS domain-containing protein
VKVADVMSSDLCVAGPESTVGEAATLMGEHAIGSVLICDEERLVGILTERDIVRALSSAHDAPMRPAAEWMTKDPTTIRPDHDAREALRTMVQGGFRHLPVLDGDKVVGMVSMRDVAGKLTE